MTENICEGSIRVILIEIITNLIQDWELDLEEEISLSTKLVSDLDFNSVDLIQLCVAIEQHFNKKIGFQDLLMQDGRYISDLTITEMANYVTKKLLGEKVYDN